MLGPIQEGEGDYGEELVRSLDVFIEQNGHWERAASALYCHRHTLRYRIRRIEQLTGRSLGSARDRIEFWLALRGRELAGELCLRRGGRPPRPGHTGRSIARMRIGVPTEIKTDEYRVAITPAGVRELPRAGTRCWCRPGPATAAR